MCLLTGIKNAAVLIHPQITARLFVQFVEKIVQLHYTFCFSS